MKFVTVILVLTLSTLSFADNKLTNESELGYASANGNTKTNTLNVKQWNDYKWADNLIGFKARYLESDAAGLETARYLMGALRYEHQVSSHFGIFIGETYEQDKFAGYQNRYSTDLGGKYRFIESDETKLFSELGYRYMHEERFDGTRSYNNLARFFTLWENQWNKSFSTKYWIEYLPNFTEPKDWLLNTELSITAMLNSIFSLKTGVLIRYDHFPAPGIRYTTDTLFTTALVAKF